MASKKDAIRVLADVRRTVKRFAPDTRAAVETFMKDYIHKFAECPCQKCWQFGNGAEQDTCVTETQFVIVPNMRRPIKSQPWFIVFDDTKKEIQIGGHNFETAVPYADAARAYALFIQHAPPRKIRVH